MTSVPDPYFPLAGASQDGWSDGDRATATCFCGAVQLSFPTHGPGLVNTFICHCTDCRKITASMFASNFTVADTHLVHERGRDNLSTYSQSKTIGTGNTMTNYSARRTVDDFHLHESKLKPKIEQFVEDRVAWLHAAEGVAQVQGFPYARDRPAGLGDLHM
ncbi:Mss4-like protein [Aspergillus varians]